jgi:adenylyl-sulfate kinase
MPGRYHSLILVQSTASTEAQKSAPSPQEQRTIPGKIRAEAGQGHGLAIFLTGLSGAGKTAIAREIETRLSSLGCRVTLLDGDDLRARVSPDLGFSRSDREANLRRAAIIASEVVKHGGIVICSFIAPYEQSRREIQETVQQQGSFFLVHVATPREECERRDPKGLYRKARAGLLSNFTGISDVYEEPAHCDLKIDTTSLTPQESARRIARALASKGLTVGLWLTAALHLVESENPAGIDANSRAANRNRERQIRLLQRVLEAMAERRVTLTELAAETGVERHTIEKVLRATTGRSFRELQRTMLLERANVLAAQGKAIKEIAFELRFGSPQAFHRFIRKTSGRTPSLLRCAG